MVRFSGTGIHGAALGLALLCSGCSTLRAPFYYEISRDNQTSYVLGTIHIGVSATNLPEFIDDDLGKSSSYLSEVDHYVLELADKDKARTLIRGRWRERIKNESRLSATLRPDTWQKVWATISRAAPKLSDLQIDCLPPIAALAFVLRSGTDEGDRPEPLMVSRQDFNAIQADRMDLELYRKASEKRKSLIPLDQHEQLEQCTDELYVSAIEAYYSPLMKNEADNLVQLMAAYKRGDADNLLADLNASEGKLAKPAQSCLIPDRNRSWAEIITQLDPTKGPYFIAVGVRHLLGQESLLSLLEAKGFKVRRVMER